MRPGDGHKKNPDYKCHDEHKDQGSNNDFGSNPINISPTFPVNFPVAVIVSFFWSLPNTSTYEHTVGF